MRRARTTEHRRPVPPGAPVKIRDNVNHPVSSRLAAARATRGTYRDHGFAWDNTGRNGHYSSFVWTGP